MMRLILFLAGCWLMLAAAAPALAQNPFAPRVTVDDRAITAWEVAQRARFLELFNTPGDLEAEAIERLIDERLQLAEARRMGITVTPEQIAEGMAEFAARVDLSTEDFLQIVGQEGIEPESFSSFVEAGLAWRFVLQRRFAGRIEISDTEIDRARALSAHRGGVRVLLSEIVLPNIPEAVALAEELSRITGFEAFAAAARQYSASDSAARGGQIDWLPLANLPDGVQPILRRLRPGQVTPPIPAGEAIVLFQLRAIDLAERLPASSIQVDYARALIAGAGTPAAEAEVARLRARVDTCRDLAALTPGGEEAFTREERPLSEVPADIAAELDRLDEREISANLRQGGSVVLLMLCAREPGGEILPAREAQLDRMVNERVQALADGLLAELRAAATITRR